MDADVGHLLTAGGGFFTRSQALAIGWSDRGLTRAVREQVLYRLRRGCFTDAALFRSLDDAGRHVLAARAAVACQVGRVALTGASAAALHGLTTYGLDLDTVHVVRLDGGSARHEVGVTHHVLRHDITKDLELKAGLLTVNVARTVWEVATQATLESAVCVADSALRLFPSIADDLGTISATFGRRPRSRQARLAVDLADGGAESPGESLSRVLFHRHQIPAPRLQHCVYGPDGERVATTDFYWPDHHHVGEFDGRSKYTAYLRPGEEPGDVVFREKQREDAVRAVGLGMTRWVWRDLMPPSTEAFVLRLRVDLERSQRLHVRRSA